MRDFSTALRGGDRRSIGRANAVASALAREPSRFDELWSCLSSSEPLVRARAADALEKFSRTHSSRFAKRKRELLAGTWEDGTPEVRWHLIAITSRVAMTRSEAMSYCVYLNHCLMSDSSRIVKVMSLQAAFDLKATHPQLENEFERMISFALRSSWPSLKARAVRIVAKK